MNELVPHRIVSNNSNTAIRRFTVPDRGRVLSLLLKATGLWDGICCLTGLKGDTGCGLDGRGGGALNGAGPELNIGGGRFLPVCVELGTDKR